MRLHPINALFKITLIGCIFLLSKQSLGITPKSLHVGLHASWPSTSSAAEALAWLVHTTSNEQALPFLATFTKKRSALPDNRDITESVENQIILESVKQLFPASVFTTTLNWVLHSRQFSPHIHFHYSIAEEALSCFPGISPPPIFAVQSNSDQTSAFLISQPGQLLECASCQKADPTFDPHLLFQPLTDEILINPRCTNLPTTIVYADLSSSEFASWLPQLTKAASKCDQPVAFRFWRPEKPSHSPSLQGFTVRATLKSTEYKVVDDRVFQTQLFSNCGYGERVCERKNNSRINYLWSDTVDEKTTFTGVQVLQYLQSKADGDFDKVLQHLRTFAEDGPSVTRTKEFIRAEYVSDDTEKQLMRSIKSFRRSVGGQDFFFINGHAFDLHSLRQGTEKLMGCLSAISSSTAQLKISVGELGQDMHVKASMRKAIIQKKNALRVGLEFEQFVPNSLIWFNDIFNDLRYKPWRTLALDSEDDISVFVENVKRQSRRKTSEGMDHTRLVKVKSNHLSLLLVLDPGDERHFDYLRIPESVIRADLPIHVGVVMVPNGQKSSMIAAAFYYFLRIKGRKTAVRFFSMIRQIMEYMGGGFQRVPISEQLIEMAFQQIAMHFADEYHSASAVLRDDVEIHKKLKEAEDFANSLNLFENVAVEKPGENSDSAKKLSLLCLLNGVVVKDVAKDVIPTAIAEQQRIASLLRSESLPEVKKANSPFGQWVATDSDLIIVNRLSQEMRAEQGQAAYKERNDGLSTIKASLIFALRNDIEKIMYIRAENNAKSKGYLVTVWLAAADHTTTAFQDSRSALLELASSPFATRTKSRYAVVPPGSPLSNAVLDCHSSTQCRTEPTYSINGKLISASALTTVEDLIAEVAFAYESQSVPEDITGALRLQYQLHSSEVESKCSHSIDAMIGGDAAITFSSVVNAAVASNLTDISYMSSAMTRMGEVEQSISLAVVLDPTHRDSYIVATLIEAIRKVYSDEDLSIQLILAPTSNSLKQHFDQPVTYRRFLLDSEPAFHEDSQRRRPPQMAFRRLPQQNVLTAALEPPRAWFVSSFATNYDMDNIILDGISHKSAELHSEYELKNLIVEGSCIDETESPPQGLQLILENNSGIAVDTLVMANLGYFQLKVPTPGRWKLRLAPGPSSDIFSMRRMEMYKDGLRTVFHSDSLGQVRFPVDSLSGAGGILLRVERNPGMNGRSVLASNKPVENDGEKKNFVGRIWRSVNRMYSEGKNSQQEKQGRNNLSHHDMIHVFSVASGHLYERFLKIMISSVTKHASRPVKFWLLENYLSPSFKKVLPLFAKKHGADIGMVTYRWPGWLRAQTEKQRIIWAYKILFLDVLFPLDVGRIIFVDSDQVIRGDLSELMDIDLHGAPYGYVPFCDSRKEVEGFRFWKTGFWKETLRGAKYRISALYVVDLNRFRETAAGDTLRYIYQTLSADPNSLSNLDQDLPNYASVASGGDGIVPIFDLPQEWLWCESWCDDESKKTAKAIDLCNNPMTKEPKLVSAKRIISEWVSYDDDASKLTEELYQTLVDKEKVRQRDISNGSPESIRTEAKDEL